MKKIALLLAAAALIHAPLHLDAATHTWTGNSSGLWNVPANWENNSVPAANESPLHLVFPTNATRRLTTNNIPNLNIDSIKLAGAAYTIAANSSATNITYDSSEGFGHWNIQVLSGAGHQLLSSFRFVLDGNLEFLVATNASVEVSSQLSAATAGSGLTKDGPGTLILSPILANTFDGTTSIRDGTLRLEGGFFFGGFTPVVTVPGPLIIGNNSPNAHANCLVWEANQIADSSAVTVNDNGELNLADVNDTIGSLTMVGGIVDTLNATLTLNGNVTAIQPPSLGADGQIFGTLHLGNLGRIFDVQSGDLYVFGSITGGNIGNSYAGVTKIGPGFLVFDGANTYDGYTFVNEGTLLVSDNHGLGSTNRPTSVTSNATLMLSGVGFGPTITGEGVSLYEDATLSAPLDSEWDGPVTLAGQAIIAVGNSNATFTISGVIDGSGGFTKTGFGELILAGSQNNTFTGGAFVDDGKLGLNSTAIAIPGPLTIGEATADDGPVAKLYADNQIADTAAVRVNLNSSLWLNTHDDTIGSLTFAGGFASTGLDGSINSPGLLVLNGNVTNILSSGLYGSASISGRLSLGNFNRIFHIAPVSQLTIYANIGGSIIFNPGFTVTGGGQLRLFGGTNIYGGTTVIEHGAIELIGSTQLLGTTNAGTVVQPNGQLQLSRAFVVNEPLTLNGGGVTPIIYVDTNTWTGPIVLNGICRVQGDDSLNFDALLTLSGVVSGSGAMRKTGQGDLRFTGLGANTFTGGLHAEGGLTYFAKTASAASLNGPLFVGRSNVSWPADHVIVETHNQIPNNVLVTTRNSGALTIDYGVNETLGDIVFEGGALVGFGTPTLSGDVTNRLALEQGRIYGHVALSATTHNVHCEPGSFLDVDGVLEGGGGISLSGWNGELHFRNTNTYAGLTTVKSGTLVLFPDGRPGATNNGTVVEGDGYIYLVGAGVTNETLTFQNPTTSQPVILTQADSFWTGPIVVHTTPEIRAFSPSILTLRGTISGSAGLRYEGNFTAGIPDDTLVLAGTTDNTFQGPFEFEAGTLVLNKLGTAVAVASDLIVGLSTTNAAVATVICSNDYQLNQAFDGMVTVNSSGTFDCNGFQQLISNLTLRDGWMKSTGTQLDLWGNIIVEQGTGANSYFLGGLRLVQALTPLHEIDVRSNAVLWAFGDINEGLSAQHLTKLGTGYLLMLGSNSFRGTFNIENGMVSAGGARPFGTTNGATIVHAGATLSPLSMTNAEPFGLSGNGFTNSGALHITGTNVFTGPVTLSGNATVVCDEDTILTLGGAISGFGGFIKEGAGAVRLTGTNANTFNGSTLVNKGTMEFAKTNAVAVPGALTVNGAGINTGILLFQSHQIADSSAVTLNGSGWFYLNNFDETIGSLSGNGTLFQNNAHTGRLTVGANNNSTTFTGGINGGGGLTKVGAGALTLTAINPYTGSTIVSNGTLIVNGQQSQSPVNVLNGATLGGSGRVGNLNVAFGGKVSPGTSPGALSAGLFNLNSSSAALHIEINGSAPGTGYDQVKANGNVSFMGGTLTLAMNTSGAVSNQYLIVDNDGVDSVGGTFTGLINGASITNNGTIFVVKYNGGDGNDVVLIQQNVGVGPQIGGIQPIGGGSMQINGMGISNTLYSVHATTDLNPPVAWSVIGTALSDSNGVMSFTDTNAVDFAMRFYRFRLP